MKVKSSKTAEVSHLSLDQWIVTESVNSLTQTHKSGSGLQATKRKKERKKEREDEMSERRVEADTFQMQSYRGRVVILS